MNLKDLARAPELIKLTLDSEEIVQAYGEALDFYILDRQPMETFLKLATGDQEDFENRARLVAQMILDDQGNPVIQPGTMLPSRVMIAAFGKLVDYLGK